MSAEIKSEILIEASPETVWFVLTDFACYAEWNPFVKSIVGELREGSLLQIQLQAADEKVMQLNPTITAIVPNKRLVWLGSVLFPGIYDSEHTFEIKPLNRDCVVLQNIETNSGLMSGLIIKLIGQCTREGLLAMNSALKQRIAKGEYR